MACSMDWKLVLEYLKVLLAWPVVVGAGGIAAGIYFREELKGLLNRISSVKIMGQEVALQQANVALERETAPAPESGADEGGQAPDLDVMHLNPAEQDVIRQAFESERTAARLWEYRFMNYFFAPTTQAVLNWLAQQAAVTVDGFEATWMHQIPNGQERKAVITALQMHQCVEVNGALVTVTEKGRDYMLSPVRRVQNVTLNPVPLLPIMPTPVRPA